MDSVRAEVAGLMARLNALESSWSGGASAAFQQAVQQWRATQQQVEQVMGSINQALGVAASSYGNVEQDVQRMFAV